MQSQTWMCLRFNQMFMGSKRFQFNFNKFEIDYNWNSSLILIDGLNC